jgi:predicted metallopeptidase
MFKILKLLITLLLIFFLSCSENRERPNYELMNKVVQTGLEVLDLDVNYSIRKLSPKLKGIATSQGLDLDAHINYVDNTYIIGVTRMNENKIYKVMSHELIHIRQMEIGDLVYFKNTKTVIYKGKYYRYIQNIPYEDRPWEIDAQRQTRQLSNAIKKKMNEMVHNNLHNPCPVE